MRNLDYAKYMCISQNGKCVFQSKKMKVEVSYFDFGLCKMYVYVTEWQMCVSEQEDEGGSVTHRASFAGISVGQDSQVGS